MKPQLGKVLVVDDEPQVLKTTKRILVAAGYEVESAEDAETALAAFQRMQTDLVITDMNMPGRSGLALIEEVRALQPDVATIMLTAVDDRQLAEKVLDLGAYGYIIKPFQPNELLIATSNALRRRMLEIDLREHRDRLEEKVRARTSDLWTALQTVEKREQDLRVSREDTIERLAMAAEFRDTETASHISRMSRYCGLLATAAGLDRETSDMIRITSIMHDVGKIGIPDSILLKATKFTPDEYAFMQHHAEFGHRILSGSQSDMLNLAATIALTHHERYDGSGYPNGLAGEDIPLPGRIAAIGDVFDALTSDRVYRRAFPVGVAVEMMKEGSGTHFDRDLLGTFLDVLSEALVIKEKHDSEALAIARAKKVGDFEWEDRR